MADNSGKVDNPSAIRHALLETQPKQLDFVVMLYQGNFIFDGTVQQIQNSPDPIIQRFVRGEAGEEELASLNENGG